MRRRRVTVETATHTLLSKHDAAMLKRGAKIFGCALALWIQIAACAPAPGSVLANGDADADRGSVTIRDRSHPESFGSAIPSLAMAVDRPHGGIDSASVGAGASNPASLSLRSTTMKARVKS